MGRCPENHTFHNRFRNTEKVARFWVINLLWFPHQTGLFHIRAFLETEKMGKKAAKYTLTDEHRAQLTSWADRWIANAMSCEPMDDTDREAMRVAIRGMYEAANLTPPLNIVFVPSPLVARVAAGFAAAIWWLRDNSSIATDAAIRDATRAATRDATDAATRVATDAAWAYTLALKIERDHAAMLCDCAVAAYRMANGGNHWSGWVAFLSFFRHVAKLDLPVYEKWKHYENAAIHGSWRYMHPKFCIVSDRPEFIKIDENRRPHCESGPSHQWRDGWKLYHWHGVAVPAREFDPFAEQARAVQD
jgi:hypothetical protein